METISTELQKKIDRAIRLIKTAVGDREVEVSYSGGKDSDVILELAKMSGVKYKAIYKATTIDPPGTVKHAREMGAEVLWPKARFFELIEKNGWPTRRARFCCSVLKEYKVMDVAIHGIRREESAARTSRYSESDPVICRIYGSKKNHVSVILPILGWTAKDVAEFIKARSIKCHPLYYDERGEFHPERRLGCMACPLRSDQGYAEFMANPRLFRTWCIAFIKWWNTHPNANTRKKFPDPYAVIAHNIFFHSYEDWKIANDGLFGAANWKEYLENKFNIKLP